MPLVRVKQRCLVGEDVIVQASGAEVLVSNAESGQIAVLFSDRDGDTVQTNPVIADVSGFVEFYANPGRYDIQITHPEGNILIRDYLLLNPDANAEFNPDYPGRPVDGPAGGNGDVWGPLPRGLETANLDDWSDVDFESEGVFYVVGIDGYITKTVDGGLNWQELQRGAGTSPNTTVLQKVVCDGNGVIFVVGNSEANCSYSHDFGTSWTQVAPGSFGQPMNGGAATDRNGVWICCSVSGYTWRSINNCVSWSQVTRGLNSGSVSATFNGFAHYNGTWVAVGTSGYCSISTNGDATVWSGLTRGLNSGLVSTSFQAVAAGQDGVFIAVGVDGRASRSEDGVTWTGLIQGLNCGLTTATFESIYSDGFGRWVVVARDGWASFSEDNGLNWTALPRGLNSGSSSPDFQGVVTDQYGTWVAVGEFARASISLPLA